MFTLIKENQLKKALEGSFSDSIHINREGNVKDLKIHTDISGSNVGGIELKIVAPSGKEVQLQKQGGDASNTFYGALVESLIGEQAKGNWTIMANSSEGENTLNSWGLELDCDAYDNHKAEIFIPEIDSERALTSAQNCRFNGRVIEAFIDLELEHPLIGDLVISIVAPSGKEVALHDRAGGSQNYLKAAYDSKQLGALAGEQTEGTWTLKVKNMHTSNNGLLKHWKIKFHYEPEDDLKVVEGIGPKIEELLKNAGIYSYVTLATTTPEAIKNILVAAGDRFQMHDPGTWPTQSSLAAQGRWEELDVLKAQLDGGR